MPSDRVEILFAITPNYIPCTAVVVRSILDKTKSNVRFNILYAHGHESDNIHNLILCVEDMVSEFPNASIRFFDVDDKMGMFEGQRKGAWTDCGYSHYIYWLAPVALPDVEKVVFFDTDMVCLSDVVDIWKFDIGDKTVVFAEPNGFTEKEKEDFNSGFCVMNLRKWREDNTLSKLLDFGLTCVEHSKFGSDQTVLNLYFRVNHSEELGYVEKTYNIHPWDVMNRDAAKVYHFCGPQKPWHDVKLSSSFGFHAWWRFARKTPFYEQFLFNSIHFMNLVEMTVRNERLERRRRWAVRLIPSKKIRHWITVIPLIRSLAQRFFQGISS